MRNNSSENFRELGVTPVALRAPSVTPSYHWIEKII
jgi:hypothetical protein